ncbi:MAG: hypothetical protein EXQ49_09505 [Acidobacteria bacterium]|nr:hypothetical protein [Acidobacteriota bacterium]
MTTHLSPQESVTALDDVLPESRQAHLKSCASCQTEVDGLRAMMVDLGDAEDVPEPSPLFWDHFQSRVQAAVQGEMVRPARVSWWSIVASVRGAVAAVAAVAAAATVAAVTIAVALYPGAPVAPVAPMEDAQVAVADDAMALETAEWAFVSGMLDSFEPNDVREVLAPSTLAVDNAFASLTSGEREVFAKLLSADLAQGME